MNLESAGDRLLLVVFLDGPTAMLGRMRTVGVEARLSTASGGVLVVLGRVAGKLVDGAARHPTGAAAIFEASRAAVLGDVVGASDVRPGADQQHHQVPDERARDSTGQAARFPRPCGDRRVSGRNGILVRAFLWKHIVLVRGPHGIQHVTNEQSDEEDARHNPEGRGSLPAASVCGDRPARLGQSHPGHDLADGQGRAAAREPQHGVAESVGEAVANAISPPSVGDPVARQGIPFHTTGVTISITNHIRHERLSLLHSFRGLQKVKNQGPGHVRVCEYDISATRA
jgi:hypothetical protein